MHIIKSKKEDASPKMPSELEKIQGEGGSLATKDTISILYQAVKDLKPQFIVELGTGPWGATARAMALVLKDENLSGSKFYSVDIDLGATQSTLSYLNNFQLTKYCTLVTSGSVEFLNSLPPKTIDFLFIDTDHTHDQTLRELNAALEKLIDDPIIFMHDILQTGVMAAITDFLLANLNWQFIQCLTPNETVSGCGYLIKRNPP